MSRYIISPEASQDLDEITDYDEADEDILKPAVESFRQGWKEAMTGQRLPISQLSRKGKVGAID